MKGHKDICENGECEMGYVRSYYGITNFLGVMVMQENDLFLGNTAVSYWP